MQSMRVIWLSLTALVMVGCSGGDEAEDARGEPASGYASDHAGEYEDHDRTETEEAAASEADEQAYMLKNGYRKGMLTVELTVQQIGSEDKSDPGDNFHGPRSESWSFEYSMTTTANRPVWLAPDFNELVPSLNDPDLPPTAWQESPYFPRGGEGFSIDGGGSFSFSSTTDAPTASDHVHTAHSMNANATVTGFAVTAFEPSLFGKGHEFSGEWEISWNVLKDSMVIKKRDGEVLSFEDPRETESVMELRLLPPINPDGLNPYPLIDDDAPEVERAARKAKQIQYDSVRNLETANVLWKARSGLVTQLGDDRVVLSYRYEGPKQIPYAPPGFKFASLFKEDESAENTMEVTVTLESID